MPKVVDAARATTRRGVVWRECAGCGLTKALAPDACLCTGCVTAPVREASVSAFVNLATWHSGGLAGAAGSYEDLAVRYEALAAGLPGAGGAEASALAADLREAARRIRGGRS